MVEFDSGFGAGMVRWAEIYLNRIRDNYSLIKSLMGKKRIIAVVKANAYGHGSVEVAEFLEKNTDVELFAVATFDEGRELRERGIKRKIIVMSTPIEMGVKEALDFKLTPVVFDFEGIKLVKELGIPFQVKVDTGMGRLGFLLSDQNRLIEELRFSKVEGVMSHFPSADEDEEFTRYQFKSFISFVKKLNKALKRQMCVHIDNSSAVRFKFNSLLTHSRIGIALYGSKPSKDFPVNLKQVMEVKSKVIQVKELPKGYGISYGRTYVTKKREKVAVVAFGYADGLMRSLSNKGYLLVNGEKCKIRGRVCMDMTVVSADGVPVSRGDVAVVSNEDLRFDEIADLAGTIPYEVMCGISPRVKRIFLS